MSLPLFALVQGLASIGALINWTSARVLRQLEVPAIIESEPFKEWLKKQLAKKDCSVFAPFVKEQAELKWYEERDLRVVVSDISQKEMRVLPDDLKEYYGLVQEGRSMKADFGVSSVERRQKGNSRSYQGSCFSKSVGYFRLRVLEPSKFSVAEAVQLLMSIPLFFEPRELNGSTIVDGGVLSNFPLWIYDAKPGEMPHCPTFGFRLVDKAEKTEKIEKDKKFRPQKSRSFSPK